MVAWHVALGMLLAPVSSLQTAALGGELGSPQFFQISRTSSDADQNAIGSGPEIQKNADHGDANAQYKLGLVYDVGVGARQDLDKAAFWYQRAADQGHVAAQFNLGLMYASGRGVPQDLVQAHMWLNLAAAGSQAAARGERDLVAKKMTRSQVGEAVRLAREWQPKAPAQQ
jgi:TPR repeat protein